MTDPTPPLIRISAYRVWVNKEGKANPGCKPYDTDFYTEMRKIQDGSHKTIIDQCRAILDKDARDKFKCENLPSLTISVVCKDWRNTQNITEYSGLLNIDVDVKGNEHVENWGELRDTIFSLPTVVCAFISASGRGLSFVVKINPKQHKDTFFSIADELKDHLNIKVDAGVNDYTRLRFVSFDPGCCIRYNFDEIPIIQPSAKYLESKKFYSPHGFTIEPIGDTDSEYNFFEAVKKAETKYAFAEGSKHMFLVSVAISCNLMGISENYCIQQTLYHFGKQSSADLARPIKQVYKSYRSQHGKYNNESKFEALNKKLATIIVKNFLHEGIKPTDAETTEIAKENDANKARVEEIIKRVYSEYSNEYNYNKFPQITKVEVWLSKHWRFYYNKVTQQPEQCELGKIETTAVNIDEIHRQLLKNNFKFPFNTLKSLLRSEFMMYYDPVHDYFHSLEFNGDGHIDKLSSFITCEDQPFWQSQFKKSLVRCIHCGLGRQENRIVMVLQGSKQETGKTTFIRFLSPWGIEKYYTESSTLDGGKDTEFKFAENFIYNLEELAALNAHDIERLKAIISKRNVKERRAYAFFETEMPRRCNFWASTNQDGFLQDFENTRWLIFKVKAIDWGYTAQINIRDVWAEAWHLYNTGFDFRLTEEERNIRELTNENYHVANSEEELIARHFKSTNELGEPLSKIDAEANFYTATDIIADLARQYGTIKLFPNRIGRAVKRVFNMERKPVSVNGKKLNGYYLVKVEHKLIDPGKTDYEKRIEGKMSKEDRGLFDGLDK